MCMVNRLQLCSVCGGSINSPIRMSRHVGCVPKVAAPRGPHEPVRKIKIDPIKGDLREAQIEKRRKITEGAVKRAKKKPAKKKSGRKSWEATVRENQW